jgi:hypothetical protein
VVVGALALVLLAVAGAFSLLPMRLKAVRVYGARSLTSGEVVRMAGVVPGALFGPREVRLLEKRLSAQAAFSSVRVGRGLDGTLSITVVEREPAAWLPAFGCAVSADGRLLAHLTMRDPEWPSVSGIEARDGVVADSVAMAEAMSACVRTRELARSGGGAWRRLPGAGAGWEWTIDGKRVVFSGPVSEEEIKRLQRFQREFPREWGMSLQLDMRFADRVVMKR